MIAHGKNVKNCTKKWATPTEQDCKVKQKKKKKTRKKERKKVKESN